jgi:hypothetical protein
MNGFKKLCGLLTIRGSINVTQIHVFKPKGQRVVEYFSYKSKAYNMQFQVVIQIPEEI